MLSVVERYGKKVDTSPLVALCIPILTLHVGEEEQDLSQQPSTNRRFLRSTESFLGLSMVTRMMTGD